jgi:type II secretory pathway component PulJ
MDQTGDWEDVGVGYVTVDTSSESPTINVKSELDESTSLLRVKISIGENYHRQAESLIIWQTEDDLQNLALSFQEKYCCTLTFTEISDAQKSLKEAANLNNFLDAVLQGPNENVVNKQHSHQPQSGKRGKEMTEEKVRYSQQNMYQEEKTPSENDDECFVCHLGGDLIPCDGCPKYWHLHCLPSPQATIPKGNWLCPSCLKKKYQQRQATQPQTPPLPAHHQTPPQPLHSQQQQNWQYQQSILHRNHSPQNPIPTHRPVAQNHTGRPQSQIYGNNIHNNHNNSIHSPTNVGMESVTMKRMGVISQQQHNSPVNTAMKQGLPAVSRHNVQQLVNSVNDTQLSRFVNDNKLPDMKNGFGSISESNSVEGDNSGDSADGTQVGGFRKQWYIRVFYSGKALKTDSRTLEALLKKRLFPCYPELRNQPFQLHYTDDEGEKIDIIDEECFAIFLLSDIPKDLYVELEQ